MSRLAAFLDVSDPHDLLKEASLLVAQEPPQEGVAATETCNTSVIGNAVPEAAQ